MRFVGSFNGSFAGSFSAGSVEVPEDVPQWGSIPTIIGEVTPFEIDMSVYVFGNPAITSYSTSHGTITNAGLLAIDETSGTYPVTVTATNAEGSAPSDEFDVVLVIDNSTGIPTIHPQPDYEVGNLVVGNATPITDPDGLTGASWIYKWYREGTGSSIFTGQIYPIAAADDGKRIRMSAEALDDLGNPVGPHLSDWSTVVGAGAAAVYAKFTDVGRSGHGDYQVTETSDGSSYWPLDIYPTTGKHYCEFTQVSSTNDNPWLGVAGSSSTTIYLGNGSNHVGLAPITGLVRNSGSDVATISSTSVSDGTVYGILYDADLQTVEWFVDGTSLGSHTTTIAGASLTAGWGQGSTNSDYTIALNAGQAAFAHPENIPVGCHLGWGADVAVKT